MKNCRLSISTSSCREFVIEDISDAIDIANDKTGNGKFYRKDIHLHFLREERQ